VFNYNVNTAWNFAANGIWDPIQKQVDNSTLNLHYQPDPNRVLNLGFSFVRNGDINSGIVVNNSTNNLKLTDVSFSWPIFNEINMLARWSQDWNQEHFQNLLYGLQYDTCCWAVRLVGSRTFTNLAPDTNTPQYDTIYYVQFNLKGLGNIGSGNPNGLLSNISG
jgi:LPS-assembly protein